MKKVLLVYTTNSGSTEEVAQVIGEGLGKRGLQVEVCRLEEAAGIDSYDAVIVGAPMILGWHRAAQKFVKQHRSTLARKQVAYFFTAMNLTATSESQIGTTPIFIDTELARLPKNPSRLSLKERYARVGNYLQPALNAAPGVKPVSAGFFGGKLELFRLKWWQILFVMVVIGAQPGDRRNWTAMEEWAAQLSTVIQGKEAVSGV